MARRYSGGNLYINRATTGAIVLRQPFGGMGKSSFGPGIKAGGPNYVAPIAVLHRPIRCYNTASSSSRCCGFADASSPWRSDAPPAKSPACSPPSAITTAGCARNFGQAHDHFPACSARTIFRRYRPLREVRIRVHRPIPFEIFARACAAQAAAAAALVSTPPELHFKAAAKHSMTFTDAWAGAIEFLVETDRTTFRRPSTRRSQRVRFAAPDRVPLSVRTAAAEAFVHLADRPVLAEGRVELLWYLATKASATTIIATGNLGARSEERRTERCKGASQVTAPAANHFFLSSSKYPSSPASVAPG